MSSIGRIYEVGFQAISITAQQDLFYVKPAADKITLIHGAYISNVGGTADIGDAGEEDLRIEAIYLPATVTVGSGGAAATAIPKLVNDTAYGGTCRTNDTTVATTSGSAVRRHSDGWNIRIPWVWLPPPEDRDVFANAAALVLRLVTTPADALTVNGSLVLEELP